MMPVADVNDWSPEAYSRFRGFRLRPALDLLGQIGALPVGDVIDLGCGNGAVAAPLRHRFADRRLVGVDSSAAMLSQARGLALYDALCDADAATWTPDTPPALVFSNALLHWLPEHERLLPRLVGCLAPKGSLAVQMPRQYANPSHALLRRLAAEMFPDRFAEELPPPVATPDVYARLLAPHGESSIWETEYLQRLAPQPVGGETGHPVRHFTQSTAMRPFLAEMSDPEAAAYIAAYDRQLEMAYPTEDDGSVLFPFRRLFIILRRDT